MNYDSERIKTIRDEMPLIFRIDGCAIRRDLIKIVSSMNKKYSNVDDIIEDANHLLRWINNDQQSKV